MQDQNGDEQLFFQVYLDEALLESAAAGYPSPSLDPQTYGVGSWFRYANQSDRNNGYESIENFQLNGSGRLDDFIMKGLDPQIIPGFRDWQKSNFTETEIEDPNISGPEADPNETGIANLYRYSLGLDLGDSYGNALPRMSMSTVGPLLSMRQLSGTDTGVNYIVEWKDDLTSVNAWKAADLESDMIVESITTIQEGFLEEIKYRFSGESTNLFYRIKVEPKW